ncbi:MAG: lipopolysaccharide transport periplasmic protein LptA [Xanthomonadales bacterium]|jgi:lipopolysaccharide export system protein LptA|nr:lipopolysaccharide transport periplasmic protein LptA [Xanthomonadales bacterium]MBK7145679.1 lipopolysaccharide transport periplasmic protein LptA [Xanthomonadales bacterium]
MPRSRPSAEVLLISLFLAAPAALALESDREQTMQIDADHAKGDAAAGTTLLTGNVRIDQGSLSIRADRAEVEQQDQDIRRVLLDGTPVHLEQEIEQQGRLKADAERIEYLLAEQKVVLSGNVRIERPRGVMTGTRIVYQLDTGEMIAGEAGSRVHMTIAPKAKAATPADVPKS